MTIPGSALLLLMVALCAGSEPAGSAELNDGFNSKPLNKDYWDPCQVDAQRLLAFSEVDFGGDKRRAIVNTVDPKTGKPDSCPDGQVAFLALQSVGISLPDADIDSSESLGKSLVPQNPSLSGPAQCPPGDKVNFQRNELRPWQNVLT